MTAHLAWRAMLFVPADAPKFIESAITHKPDAVILDLEDSVAAEHKLAARKSIAATLDLFAAAGIVCVFRLNHGLRDMIADINALDGRSVAALLVPKCDDDRALRNATELLGGPTKLLALIESPAALARLEQIAASPHVAGLMFGSEDYATALGVSPDSPAMDLPCMQIAASASAAGIAAFGMPGSIANFRDIPHFKATAERARDFGFIGAAAIHPAQLPALREAFGVDRDEVEWARLVLKAFEAGGTGVAKLDGRMLDAPVVARARRVIQASGV
jgi:citrate lyase subunit beta / citryl-CoA lyase